MVIVLFIGLILFLCTVLTDDYFIPLIISGIISMFIGMVGILIISCTPSTYYPVKYIDNKVTVVEESNYSIEHTNRMSYVWFNKIDTYALRNCGELIVNETSNFSKIEKHFNPTNNLPFINEKQ